MNLSKFFFLVSTLGLGMTAHADIRQVKTMAEALAPVDAETLLILDIDNTVLETKQTLGSDQWFESFVYSNVLKLIQAGKSEADARRQGLQESLVIWKAVHQVTEVQALEATTIPLIHDKQREKIRVMGLTARPLDLATVTREQLGKLRLDFMASPIYSSDVMVSPAKEMDLIAKYEKGILYAGNNKKGETLVRFLSLIKYSPKKIIFVDDRQKNVDSVEESLNALGGVVHTSMRYGAADAKIAAFDKRLADVQLQYFGRILTDGAATILLRP